MTFNDFLARMAGIPLPTQGYGDANETLLGFPTPAMPGATPPSFLPQPNAGSVGPVEQLAALLTAMHVPPPQPRQYPSREGIGTSYGAWGQPDSQSYRTGKKSAPTTEPAPSASSSAGQPKDLTADEKATIFGVFPQMKPDDVNTLTRDQRRNLYGLAVRTKAQNTPPGLDYLAGQQGPALTMSGNPVSETQFIASALAEGPVANSNPRQEIGAGSPPSTAASSSDPLAILPGWARPEDRAAAYRAGELRKDPPRDGLADEITSADVLGGKITVNEADGTRVTYSNEDLAAMAPEERARIAHTAVSQQQSAFDRYQRQVAPSPSSPTPSPPPPDPLDAETAPEVVGLYVPAAAQAWSSLDRENRQLALDEANAAAAAADSQGKDAAPSSPATANPASAQLAATPGPSSAISGGVPPAVVGQYQPAAAQFWGTLSPADRLTALQAATAAQGGAAPSPFTGPVADVAGAVTGPLVAGTETVANAVTDPVGTAKGVAGAVADAVTHPIDSLKAAGSFLGEALDQPRRQVGRRLFGEALHELVNSTGAEHGFLVALAPPGLRPFVERLADDESFKTTVNTAYDQGGATQVWEDAVAGSADDWNPIVRALYLGFVDTVADPLTYVGAVGKAGEVAKVATEGTKLEDVGKAIGAAAKLPEQALNVPVDLAKDALSATGRGAVKIPGVGGFLDRLAKETPESTYRRTGDEIAGALEEQAAHATPPTTAPTGFVPEVSPEARAILDRPTSSGQTVEQIWFQHMAQANTDIAEAQRLAARLTARPSKATTEDLGKLAVEELKKLLPAVRAGDARDWVLLRDEWSPFGDLLSDTPERLSINRTTEEAARDLSGYTPKPPSLLNLLIVGTARDSLHGPLNWSYSTRNLVSDEEVWQLAFPGSKPLTSIEGLKAARTRNYVNLPSWKRAEALSLGRPPREVAQAVDKLGNGTGASATRQLFERARLAKLGDVVGKPIEWKASIDAGLEQTRRLAAWDFRADVRSAEAVPKLKQTIIDEATRKGLPITEADVDGMIARLPLTFSPNAVYDELKTIAAAKGLAPRAADDLARTGYKSWTDLARTVRDQALEDISRPLPTARLRNIERPIGNVLAFHQWQSRMMPFLVEEGLRNPILVATWLRARDGIDRIADEGGYPDAVKGWLKAMTTPAGFAIFLSSNTFAVASQLMDVGSQADGGEDGLTLLGKLKRDARKFGIGPWPVIDALTNVTGAYGEDFAPSPLIFKEFRLLSTFTDLASSLAGEGPHQKAWERAMLDLRQKVSGALEGVVPGIHQVDATNPNAYTEDLIASKIAQDHPDYDEERLTQAMNDPDSREYLDAFRAVAVTGALSTLWNTVAPVSTKARLTSRDETIRINKEAEGVPYDQRTPEQQAAHDIRQAETAGSPEARTLASEQGQYANVGTNRDRQIAAHWNSVAHPTGDTVEIDGKVWTTADLLALDDDTRMALADRWVQTLYGPQGTTDLDAYRANRDAYVQAHPEYGGYDVYQGVARNDYPGGPARWRQDLAQQNPNFARALKDQVTYLSGLGLTGTELTKRLDDWTAGMAAYQAAEGIKGNAYGPDPLSTGSTSWQELAAAAKVLAGGTGSGAAKTPKDPAAKVLTDWMRYQVEEASFNLAVEAMFGPGSRYENANPMLQNAMRWHLQQAGISIPSMPQSVEFYQRWAANQPAGTDTSVAAYGAWRKAFDPAIRSEGYDPEMVLGLVLSYPEVFAGTGLSASGTDGGGGLDASNVFAGTPLDATIPSPDRIANG
jgi:hypothetical protein